VVPYRTADLDSLVGREQLIWVGAGKGEVAFLTAGGGWRFPPPRLPDTGKVPDTAVFPGPGDPPAGFWDIAGRINTGSGAATEAIWNRVWEGRLTCGDMGVLRRGTLAGFRAPPAAFQSGRGGRPAPGGLKGWRSGRPVEGRWYAPAYSEEPDDPFVADTLVREQVRLLLGRYGILSRPLLEREIQAWRWPALSRTLSLMELGDELIGGRWFDGLPMPQFMAPESLTIWRDGAGTDRGWCIDASDPASICGTGLDERMPARREGTWIAWNSRGELLLHLQPGTGELHLTEKLSRELQSDGIEPFSDAAAALERLAVLLLERSVSPLRRLVIRSSCGREIEEGPVKRLLEKAGFSPNGEGGWIRRPRPIGTT
jgi:ATP-dependent Lhr-like helicase